MTTDRSLYSKLWFAWAAGFVLFAAWACKSSPSPKASDDQPTAGPAQNSADPGIDLNCVVARLQSPPESFHYSYKRNGDHSLDQEVDMTPQTLDGSVRSDNSGSDMTDAIHAVRSNADDWRIATGSLSFGIGGLAPDFALVHHGAATFREGTETVNGYETTKYTIDTSRGDAVDKVLYDNTLGPGGFEKGTVWVTSQGCPVKISLDDELHSNGTVTRDHYEEAMVKK
jgi:hypothetical protein